ncbi:unnamed protein product [Prunus armeniaca]|uniref:Transmembrane protein n=1 Tax=Prunus armeniaca TaxID=36596 RepID=A0A6J5VBZ0_PRUAR|nr:unnamed protein product [Prunus armeniaca]
MLKTLHLQTQPDFSKSSLCLFNPIVTTNTSIQNAIFVPKSPVFSVSLSLCHEIQIQKQIVCARKNKRRAGSLRLPRLLRQLMPVVVSNLKILPQPLDLVIEEICSGDGNGGGLGIWKGFGGGGGFDGFGRKRNRKLFLLFLLYGILVISGLGLLFGSEVESNVLCCGLGFGLSGVAMVQWWEKIGIFAVFFGGVLVGFGFKREELKKWGLKLRACYPIIETLTWRTRRRRRRSGRRAF